jgi:hypothetical protein
MNSFGRWVMLDCHDTTTIEQQVFHDGEICLVSE